MSVLNDDGHPFAVVHHPDRRSDATFAQARFHSRSLSIKYPGKNKPPAAYAKKRRQQLQNHISG